MGIVSKLFKAYSEEVGVKKAIPLLLKMWGVDEDTVEDEEIWRTTEEGKHFKFEDQTGEIKAGFGGKYNGQKLGGNWGTSKKKSKGGTASNGEGFKVPAPERTEAPKGRKVDMTFGHFSDGSSRRPEDQKKYEEKYSKTVKDTEKLFSDAKASNEDKYQAVYALHNAASNSDAYYRAQNGIAGEDLYGIGNVPREWAARLTPTERDVLENIATEYSELNYRETDIWAEKNPEKESAMYALQAKLLGAEIDPKLSPDILKEYGGVEEHQETPGQTSMFWGENVPGSYEGAVNLESKPAPELREAAPQSKWAKEQERRREIASKWSDERKAEHLFNLGFLSEDDAVAAMENGTIQEQIDKYFDIMEENGDPTPTKPIKKQVPLLESYTHNDRINMIKDYTGMNDTEAENTCKALDVWFGNSWEKADTRAVDEYIDRDGAVAGQIYRGLHFTEDEYQSFMDSIKVGNRIGMRGKNSSWTNDKESAWHFSNGGERSVIIQCVKNKTSAPVDHLSHYGEEEVVAHSRTQWTVIGFVEGTNRTEIKVIECEDRMSDEDVARYENNDAMPKPKEKHEAQTFADRMNEENKYFVVIPRQETAEDGGPGSGNWGHRGRPGKRGGSGKGGGVQYRGGRSDVRYVGSRKDWMNGMTGENQQRATRFIAKAKNMITEKIAQRDKIENMARRGLLTFPEAEERIKNQNLDKVSESMTPEEYVMKAGSKDEREELLNYVQSGRGWGEHADRLTQENWDETDRKLADVLCNKYGLKNVDGVNVPDDSNTQGWEAEDLLCWYDLKAKAMELPTSGDEAPDELQYEAGLKERPASPEPPKPQGPDYSWYGSNPYTGNLEAYMSGVVGDIVSYGHRFTQEEFESLNQRFVDTLKYGNPSPNMVSYYGPHAINALRNCMAKVTVQGNIRMKEDFEYTPEMFDRLTNDEQKKLLDFMNSYAVKASAMRGVIIGPWNDVHQLTTDDFYDIEKLISRLTPRSKEEKRPILDYLLMQEKMLIGAVPSEHDTVAEEKERKKEEEKAKQEAEQARKQEERKAREQATSENRKKFTEGRDERKKAYREANYSSEIADTLRSSGIFINNGLVRLARTDVGCARDIANSFETVMEKYPFLIGKIDGLDETADGNAYASCTFAGGAVHVNPSNWAFGSLTNMIQKYQEDVKTGFHPVGTDCASVVTHELGHALDGYLTMNGVNGSTILSTEAHHFSGLLRRSVLKSLKMSKVTVEREVSRYATKNAHEWFAECFAEALHSENPRPMAKEMMRQLNEILSKEGLINA